MIKAIVLDDEKHCVESLCLDLERYCPEVEVVAALTSVKECLNIIKRKKPDILFLDIEMPWMNGFELLEFLQPIDFEVIFVTAYDSYALKAFRASAVDYLMKPVDKDDLVKAIQKLKSRRNNGADEPNIKALLEQYFSRNQISKIMLPDKDGQKFVELSDIVYAEAEGNYTKVFLKDGTMIMVAMTMKSVEQKMEGEQFLRVHHSFIINMDHITQYVKSDGGYLVMSNQAQVPISRSRRSDLKEMLELKYR